MEAVMIDPEVVKILKALAKEHGTEAFVSEGYAYFDDAATAFTLLIKQRVENALEFQHL